VCVAEGPCRRQIAQQRLPEYDLEKKPGRLRLWHTVWSAINNLCPSVNTVRLWFGFWGCTFARVSLPRDSIAWIGPTSVDDNSNECIGLWSNPYFLKTLTHELCAGPSPRSWNHRCPPRLMATFWQLITNDSVVGLKGRAQPRSGGSWQG
jgi:hypothetical protein